MAPWLNKIHKFAKTTNSQDVRVTATSLSLVNGHGEPYAMISKDWLNAVSKARQVNHPGDTKGSEKIKQSYFHYFFPSLNTIKELDAMKMG